MLYKWHVKCILNLITFYNKPINSDNMFRHYIKVSFRNLWKSRGYSVTNILGLSIGMASFLIILLYLNHELNFDRWHPDLERVSKVSLRGKEDVFKATQAPLATMLREKIPQIESATHFSLNADFETPLSVEEKRIVQKGIISSDSLFFTVFPYRIIEGERHAPLDKPNAIVVSEQLAKKFFGSQSAIGKTIRIFGSYDCEVTAVIQEPAGPSHLNVQAVYRSQYEKQNFHWGNFSFLTYVKTKQPMSAVTLERLIDPIYYNERLKTEYAETYDNFKKRGTMEGLFVDAVHDIHNFPKYGTSRVTSTSILLVLASLLLIAGTINFSNLSIATSLRRAKEIGVKKALGSSQKSLFWQFMGEIAIQCFIALLFAIMILILILPYFNQEFNVSLKFFNSGIEGQLILQLLACLTLVAILSGLYPSLFLSRFNTSRVLKGDYSRGKQGLRFRNGLIVVQFVVAAFFIYGVVVVSQQLDYIQTRDRGFSDDQVMRIQAYKMSTREENFDLVRSKLLQIPGVESVSKTTRVPNDLSADTSTTTFKSGDKEYRMTSVKISKDFFITLKVELMDGRLFDESYADQHTRSAIVNQTAANLLGHKDGKETFIAYPGCDSLPIRVVGVVRDFNVLGMEQQIQPSVFTIGNDACVFQSGGAILVKVSGNDIKGKVSSIEKVWKEIEPDFDMKYDFLDDNFQRLFSDHIRLQKIVSFFGITAIVISLTGLFALAAFLIGQRRKEISIRKVLGADMIDLGLLLGKDFFRMIIIAVVIAVPIGWWAGEIWLRGFAYRTQLSGWVFGLCALAIMTVVALTVGIHIVKVSRADVADDLRDE